MHRDESIIEDLRAKRRERHLSQAQLSRRAGLPLRTYQRLEDGDKGARLETLLRALTVLGYTLRTEPRRRPALEELKDLYGHED
jgi:transcriptional regulator with XRE-family HTH domain